MIRSGREKTQGLSWCECARSVGKQFSYMLSGVGSSPFSSGRSYNSTSSRTHIQPIYVISLHGKLCASSACVHPVSRLPPETNHVAPLLVFAPLSQTACTMNRGDTTRELFKHEALDSCTHVRMYVDSVLSIDLFHPSLRNFVKKCGPFRSELRVGGEMFQVFLLFSNVKKKKRGGRGSLWTLNIVCGLNNHFPYFPISLQNVGCQENSAFNRTKVLAKKAAVEKVYCLPFSRDWMSARTPHSPFAQLLRFRFLPFQRAEQAPAAYKTKATGSLSLSLASHSLNFSHKFGRESPHVRS